MLVPPPSPWVDEGMEVAVGPKCGVKARGVQSVLVFEEQSLALASLPDLLAPQWQTHVNGMTLYYTVPQIGSPVPNQPAQDQWGAESKEEDIPPSTPVSALRVSKAASFF